MLWYLPNYTNKYQIKTQYHCLAISPVSKKEKLKERINITQMPRGAFCLARPLRTRCLFSRLILNLSSAHSMFLNLIDFIAEKNFKNFLGTTVFLSWMPFKICASDKFLSTTISPVSKKEKLKERINITQMPKGAFCLARPLRTRCLFSRQILKLSSAHSMFLNLI